MHDLSPLAGDGGGSWRGGRKYAVTLGYMLPPPQKRQTLLQFLEQLQEMAVGKEKKGGCACKGDTHPHRHTAEVRYV